MRCKNCNAENANDLKFCSECGTPLFIPSIKQSNKCPSCNAENDPSFMFCGTCGTPLAIPTSTKEKVEPSNVTYEDGNFRSLMAQYEMLSSFSEVVTWDTQAQGEIDRILAVLKLLECEIPKKQQELETERQLHKQKPFFSRAFDKHETENKLLQVIAEYQRNKDTLERMWERMREAIDFTPNNPESQKDLLEELKLRKKQLQIQKREVLDGMREIKTEARQKSANAGLIWGGIVYHSGYAARQRREIRYAKEAVLKPHEDTRASIERQLTQVDRDILWVKRFK